MLPETMTFHHYRIGRLLLLVVLGLLAPIQPACGQNNTAGNIINNGNNNTPTRPPQNAPSPVFLVSLAPTRSPTASRPPQVPPVAPPSRPPNQSPRPINPTLSPRPSLVPTPLPSIQPSLTPTISMSPTRTEWQATRPNVTIQFRGMTNHNLMMDSNGDPPFHFLTNGSLVFEWEQLTSTHILRYFQQLHNTLPPDRVPVVNLMSVKTNLLMQQQEEEEPSSLLQQEEGRDQSVVEEENVGGAGSRQGDPPPLPRPPPPPSTSMLLELNYQQTIRYQRLPPPSDEAENSDTGAEEAPPPPWSLADNDLDYLLFQSPFDNDAADYIIDLIVKLDLPFSWLEIVSLSVGPTDAPTSAPTPVPDDGADDGLSPASLLAISLSIVLISVLIVFLLLWDRKRKEDYYKGIIAASQLQQDPQSPNQQQQQHSRQSSSQHAVEFNRAGEPVNWQTPYDDPNNDGKNNALNGGNSTPRLIVPDPRRTGNYSNENGDRRRGQLASSNSATGSEPGGPSNSNPFFFRGAAGTSLPTNSRHGDRPNLLPPRPPIAPVSSTATTGRSAMLGIGGSSHNHNNSNGIPDTPPTYAGGGTEQRVISSGVTDITDLTPNSDVGITSGDGRSSLGSDAGGVPSLTLPDLPDIGNESYEDLMEAKIMSPSHGGGYNNEGPQTLGLGQSTFGSTLSVATGEYNNNENHSTPFMSGFVMSVKELE